MCKVHRSIPIPTSVRGLPREKKAEKKELITMDLPLPFPPALHMLHSRKNLLPFAEASEGLELELAGPGGLEAKEGTPRLGRLRACAR